MISRLACLLTLAFLLTGCGSFLHIVNWVYDVCPSNTGTSHQSYGSPDAEDLVIFIHGLCGDAKTTWTNPATHFVFPEEIAQDFAKTKPTHVVAFDYVSQLENSPSILSIAKYLEFEIGELLKKHPYRTLRIVAHSMGGVVAREYILRHQQHVHPQLKVTNLVMLATPSDGSDLARLGRLIPENRQVEELRHIDKGNPYLESLNNDWNLEFKGGGHPRHILSYAGYEGLDMSWWIGKIVTQSSAVRFADEWLEFQQDHVSIAKPKERDELYRWVKAQLEEPINKTMLKLVDGMIQQGVVTVDELRGLSRPMQVVEDLHVTLAGSELERVLNNVKAGKFQNALALLAEREQKERLSIETIAQHRLIQGEIHELQFQMAEATSKYAEAVRLSPSNLKYRLWYGLTLRNTGDSRGAIMQFDEALGLSRKNKNQLSEASALEGLGLASIALSQYRKAITYLEQALKINHDSGNLLTEGAVMAHLGVAYSGLDQYSDAIGYLKEALEINRKIEDLRGEASVLNNLGAVYRAMGEDPKAMEYHKQAIAIFRQIGHRMGEGATLINIGAAYGAMKQYSKAIESFCEALTIHAEIDDRENQGSAISNLGTAYMALGQYPKGIEYLERALRIHRRIGSRKYERDALNNLGVAHIRSRQYPKAVKYLEQALEIDREIGSLKGEGQSLANLGTVYGNSGDFTKAVKYLEQSRVIYEERLSIIFPGKAQLDALKTRKVK